MADGTKPPTSAVSEVSGKSEAVTLTTEEGEAEAGNGVFVAEVRSPAVECEETLAAEGANNEDDGGSSIDGEDREDIEEPEEALARADQLFEKGSKAIEEDNFVEAVDCLSRALEIRVSHFGELAPECVSSYYKYGCALLYKSQEEADPLVHVPKDSDKNSSRGSFAETGESSSGKLNGSSENKKGEDQGINGLSDMETEDNEEEEMGDDDEDDSDLDLAWKMLDIARAISEKFPEDTMEKVNILSALGEVALEREDIETSFNDYVKALSILVNLVEPNHRRVIELNFRICLVLELGSKVEEAIPYCKEASILCKSRTEKLKEELERLRGEADQEAYKILEKEKDFEGANSILTDLEKKLEDLQQALLNPHPLFAAMMKMIPSDPPKPEKNSSPGSTSSRLTTLVNGSGSSDSSTFSTAATGDSEVTHLGVVGRGLKRASLTSVPVGSVKKNKAFEDTSSEKVDSGLPDGVDFSAS